MPGQHPLTRERDRSKDKSKLSGGGGGSVLDFEHRDRDRSLELRESLLGQALEGGPTLSVPSVSSRLGKRFRDGKVRLAVLIP